jgi:F-type H+-transporting ATPase subunit delta
MGSATREALAEARAALAGLGSIDLTTGQQLLSAGRIIGGSSSLRSALVDRSIEEDVKRSLVNAVFASIDEKARAILDAVATATWSSEDDLLAGIEEIGIRILTESAPTTPIGPELFEFGTAVNSSPELELAVSSKLGSAEDKSALVTTLLTGKASEQTIAIVDHLVQQPRGRRIAELLESAASVVADEAGLAVATVTTATPIASTQLDRLAKALGASYGRELRINQVVDPSVVGGLRVQVGDDVIDGTVASKLNELRLQLAS